MMIFIEPDVDYFQLHLRDVRVPIPVLRQSPNAVATASESAATAKETVDARCSGPAALSVSSSTDFSETLAASQRDTCFRNSDSAGRDNIFADEAPSYAKITIQERADAVHRALLSTLHARFPYETLDTLEHVYVLVVTHHAIPSLASLDLSADDLRCLTSLSDLIPEELRCRTFPSHLNAILDPASVASVATTAVKPVPSPTAGETAADPASAAHPSIRVADDDAAARTAQAKESTARAMAQVPHHVPTGPRFYDSIFLLTRALTPEQQTLYDEIQRSGRRPVGFEAARQASATAEEEDTEGSGTHMESFSVVQGRFIHYVPLDRSRGDHPATKAASTTAPNGDGPVQMASQLASLPETRSLYFSVYRIPLSRFRPAEQQYYTTQREELRWRQRHRRRTWQRKGRHAEVLSASGRPSSGPRHHPRNESNRRSGDNPHDASASSSSSSSNNGESEEEEETWDGNVGIAGKAASPLSSAQSQHTCVVGDAIDRLFSGEGDEVSGVAEQTSVAEQRDACRFFHRCHEVLTNYAIAHSPYAAAGPEENKESVDNASVPLLPAATIETPPHRDEQCHPRPSWFPRRFPGVSYAGVTRLLYSQSPCDCYHLVMKDRNTLYYAQSSRATYEMQTVALCLVSDLSPETNASASPQHQRGSAGGGGGVLRPAQLRSNSSPRATAVLTSTSEAQHSQGGEQHIEQTQPRAPLPLTATSEEAWPLGRAAPGSSTDKFVVSNGAGGATSVSCRDGLVCTPLPPRAPLPARSARSSTLTPAGAGTTAHGVARPLPSATLSRASGNRVSATDGVLRVSASLVCNSISGNPQTKLQSLAEKGVHVPNLLLPNGERARGGDTRADSSCRSSCDTASVDRGASADVVNLFKALAQSSLAQHKLRHGSIRSVVSVAVLESPQGISDASPSLGRTGVNNPDEARRYGTRGATQLQVSQHYCCRGLVDHTWFVIPVQRTPAEQEAIEWMPVLFGSTDCVSDVGLRTAVHLGIFPCASSESRDASRASSSLTPSSPPTLLDQLVGVLPTHEKKPSAQKPSQLKKRMDSTTSIVKQTARSDPTGSADCADARANSSTKEGTNKARPPLAPLQTLPVNCANDGATAAAASPAAATASRPYTTAAKAAAPQANLLGSALLSKGTAEYEREATVTPATTIAPAWPRTSHVEDRSGHAYPLPASPSTLHQKAGVPPFAATGGPQSCTEPYPLAATSSPPITRISSSSRRPHTGLLLPATAPVDNIQGSNAHYDLDNEEEEYVSADPPLATATSVQMTRGGVALTFDAGPAQRPRPQSSSSVGGTSAIRRRRATSTTVSMRCSAEMFRHHSASRAHDRHEDSTVKRRDDDDEVPVKATADLYDINDAILRDKDGGGGGVDVSGGWMRGISATTAMFSNDAAGDRRRQQTLTKKIGWADEFPSSLAATKDGHHGVGNKYASSVLTTRMEGSGIADEKQVDVNRRLGIRGASECHAQAFGICSSNNPNKRSIGPPEVAFPPTRTNPFPLHTRDTSAANSKRAYHLDTCTPPLPSPLPRPLAYSTSLPPDRPQGVSATPPPTHRFSGFGMPFGQDADLCSRLSALNPEPQFPLHTRASSWTLNKPHDSGVSVSSISESLSVWPSLEQHASTPWSPQECLSSNPVGLCTTREMRDVCGSTAITTPTPASTGDDYTAPRSVRGDAACRSSFSCARANEHREPLPGYRVAVPSAAAAAASWRDRLSLREKVWQRRCEIEEENRLPSYRAHPQDEHFCERWPKQFCFERQVGDVVSDTAPTSLSDGMTRASCAAGSSQVLPSSTTVSHAAWTPTTTAAPLLAHDTAARSEVRRDARHLSLGLPPSAPTAAAAAASRDTNLPPLKPPTTSAPNTSGASGLSVNVARVHQAEKHLRQQAEPQEHSETHRQMEKLADGAVASRLVSGANVSFTLRDVATVFLRLPRTSVPTPRTPGSDSQHVSGGAGLEVLDICDAVWRTEGISCFLSRKPTQLWGGCASYVERINPYQQPFLLRDQAFVLVLPVPHVPTLKVCIAIHNIDDLLALVCRTPVARTLPSAEEVWMRQRKYGFEDAGDDASGRQEGAAIVVEERRWLFGLWTTRRLVPATGSPAPREAHKPLPSLKDDDRTRPAKCRQLCRAYHANGLCLTWRHRARLWYALLRAGWDCLALPACTSPLLVDPVACKARCALLCDRIAAYAGAHHRLETLKAIRQSYLQTRAIEISRERVLELCGRTHPATTRGPQLGESNENSSSSRVAHTHTLCTSWQRLAPVPLQPRRWTNSVGDERIHDTVHQSRFPATWGRATGPTFRTSLFDDLSSTEESSGDLQVGQGGVPLAIDTPSKRLRTPPLAAWASASPFNRDNFESEKQGIQYRGNDQQQQQAGTPRPPRLSTNGGVARTHLPLQQPNLLSHLKEAAPQPLPRTTHSMRLRLAANQRVAAGDAPVSSLRHSTYASLPGRGRLTFGNHERFSHALDLPSRCSLAPPSHRPPNGLPTPPQPRWGSGFGSCSASKRYPNGDNWETDIAWNRAHTREDAVVPGIAPASLHCDVRGGSRPCDADDLSGVVRNVPSSAKVAGHQSHASSAASSAYYGLLASASSTVAPYASRASLAPSSNAKAAAYVSSDAQSALPSSTAASSLAQRAAAASADLDVDLRVNRDDVLASALARLAEHHATNISPPLTTVLSNAPLHADVIPTSLELHQHPAHPFNISIAQVKQLLQWQWEHHQHCYTLMPVPLFAGAATGCTEVDASLKSWASPENAGPVKRGVLSERSFAASPSYAVSPLARELLLHLLRWSWLMPIDYEASRRSRHHRPASTKASSWWSYFCMSVSHHHNRWRIFLLIALLTVAAGNSAWCILWGFFCCFGYFVFNGVAVGLLTRLPSHRGGNSSSRRRRGWLPLPLLQRRRWWWWGGARSTSAADVRSREHCRCASRLVHQPFPVAGDDEAPPIDHRVSLLYSLGESTTHDLLERRRVHFASQRVLVHVLCLQSLAASLLSRLELFYCGYSTALSLWVALLLLAYAFLYVVYLEAVRVAQRSSLWPAGGGGGGGGHMGNKILSPVWQVTRELLLAVWTDTHFTRVTSFRLCESPPYASRGAGVTSVEPLLSIAQAAWRQVIQPVRNLLAQRLQTVVEGSGAAVAAGAQLSSDGDPVAAAQSGSDRAGKGSAHHDHSNPSYFYQNGKYYAYTPDPPAWAEPEAGVSASAAHSTGTTSRAHYAHPFAQTQPQELPLSSCDVRSPSEWPSHHVAPDGKSDGDGGGGHFRPSVWETYSTNKAGSTSASVRASSSVPHACPNKRQGFAAADPGVLWFLVLAYVVTVCMPWSPYRWLWKRVWRVLTHDDALARRPLLTV
ncbi:hypothetical protein JKF63_05818 [Porcisia hertigi]|uniref:Uncharacterized protein n=1 Tax=Porcisia hertigi TaxID=2761500 RepID=A0A836HWH3_9TRYP|nr:hypothetical protein JKF63_05818 [Porcisia hertigi]